MPTKIIAEIGINHNGDLNIAKQLIDIASDLRIDLVKFQKRTIEKVYHKDLLDSSRESPWGTTQRDQKEGLEFSESEYDEINNYCESKKIKWLASAWDEDSLHFLDKYNLDYHKVASAMIVDQNFLKAVASKKKHTFISTGMSSLDDIDNAVKIFRDNDTSFELMHCVSTYPMKTEDANLSTIKQLSNKFNCNVGYSGHETGVVISLAAVALGATSIERHITLDRSMYGSDQSASLEKRGFSELVSSIKKIEQAIGSPSMGLITEEEKSIAEKLRAHIKQ